MFVRYMKKKKRKIQKKKCLPFVLILNEAKRKEFKQKSE